MSSEEKLNLRRMWLNPRNKSIRTGIHLLIWFLLFFLPFMMFPRIGNEFRPGMTHLVPLICYAAIFYSNYLFLTDKLLFERHVVWYCLINAGLLLFFLVVIWLLHGAFRPKLPVLENMGKMFPGKRPDGNWFLLKDLFSLFIPIIFAIALRAVEHWIKTEAEKKEIVNKSLESELEHLRYQLQPHFFFNSLNNIYSLIAISPTKAQDTVLGLSKLMRYLLYESNHKEVDLAHEIAFLTNYVKLMEIRQTDKTSTSFFFPEIDEQKYFIAPLLFIPMIENAYKHGVSATLASQIYFSLNVKEDHLLFVSGNTNFPKNESDFSGSGIGLDNLRKRLELFYPGRHELKIITEKKSSDESENELFWVRLRIDFK